MKLKELLLPIAILALMESGGEAKALTADERQKIDELAIILCAHPAAADIEPGSIDLARMSVTMHSHSAEEKEKTMALFAAMKRQGCG